MKERLTTKKIENKTYKGSESELIKFGDIMYELNSQKKEEVGAEHPYLMIESIKKQVGGRNIKLDKICSAMERLIQHAGMMKKTLAEAEENNPEETDQKIIHIVFNQVKSENSSLSALIVLDLLSQMHREDKGTLSIEKVYSALDNAAAAARAIKERFERELS